MAAAGIRQIIREPDAHQHHSRDPDTLALSALGWVLADQDRADRLLALTGLTPEVLRDRLTDRAVLGAVLDFLGNHEPDLLLAADELHGEPIALIAAREALAR